MSADALRRWLGLLAIAFSLAVAGCGQKGDLYLPDRIAAQSTVTPG